MSSSELSDVAWDLVEHCRTALGEAELNAAFVRLGVGEYSEAMVTALKAVVERGGPALPADLLARLTRVAQTYHVDRELIDLLAVAPRST